MPRDPTSVYARRVVGGKVVAGKLQIQACERHLRDLQDGKARGLRFDRARAWRAITFFGTLRHTRGKWARAGFFELTPSQQFVTGSLFGWLNADGTRRFRTGYLEVARKWGKSEWAGGAELLLTFFDTPIEYGAEGYNAATKRDQARIVFDVAKKMVRRSPTLRDRLTVLTHRIIDHETGSYLTPLAADADTLDGLSPHAVVVDELHAHPTSAVVDVMESATGARDQPLLLAITTAGRNTESVCYEFHTTSCNILDPANRYEDDTWFAFICAADRGLAIDDPRAWYQANPNVGYTVDESWYATRAHRAKESPTALAEFEQKNLNRWGADAERAIQPEVWKRGARPLPEDLRGRPCFAGLDIATVNDLTAWALVWPPLDGETDWYVMARCYVPQDRIEERERTTGTPYAHWAREGFLVATPGEVTDYDFIEHDLREAIDEYDIVEIAFDRARAAQVVTHLLEEGAPMVAHGQGFMSMLQPSDDFERLVLAGQLVHGGDPVLHWCAGNLVWQRDPAGNKKPNKRRSRDKIDPIVAIIMAIGRANLHRATPSPYKDRGVRGV